MSVNPYEHLPIYTHQLLKQYAGQRMGVLPPHIFAVANAAYSALVADKRNQSVIISGESGAGKTEATKLIMQFLAQRTNKQSSVESKILEANPVLEAFGNAATVRNNNSSRFGRYVEIQFDEHCSGIKGARITNYLLEKSRIVKQAQGERNYHIFYMFSEGCTPDMKNLYGLKDMSEFHYLNQSGVYYIPNVNDKQDWQRMLTAMALLGITEEEQSDIFAVLAAILHLGNVTFGTNEKNTAVVHDEESLRLASNLLRVDHDDLKAALTSRLIDVGKERMFKPLLREEATDARDTLAKSLYDRLFNWLVGKINASISAEPEELPEGKKPTEPRFIGVLDIFGFENFAWNSLEQLCINYTNEALQQHFTQHIFKLEQKEYESQGVKWESIPFTDNQSCLDLIEGLRPPGVLALLDEESRFPKGTDESFLKKINEAHNKHKNYEMPRRRGNNFILKHYAGDVSYEVSEFLEKNRDSLSLNMAAAMNTSNLRLLNALFSEEENAATVAPPSARSTGVLAQSLGSNSNSTMRGKSASSIISSFRVQLRTLMDTLTATAPHYVRCLKPNVLKLPAVFDSDLVLNQLRYAGMMETIKIRKAGFPVRLTFDVFWRNYKCLAPQTRDLVLERENLEMVKSGLKILLDALKGQGLTSPDDFQVGKTKLFMRDKQSAKLEERRLIMLKDHVITLQKHWRGYRERKKYRKARKAAILIQSTVRMAAARRRLKRSLCLVRFMQNRMRCCIVRKRYLKKRRAAISIQCAWRRLQAKRRQAAARERKTRDRADTAAAERDRQKNEEQKKEQHQKNKKKKDDAAEDLKQEVNMKLQNQQLEELGVRTELIALQAEFEQNGASPLGKSGSFAASFSSAQHTKGEEVAEVKEREVGKPQVDPFSHEDDLLIGEESAKLFNFHSYAIRNFSQHTSGVFRRKTVTAGQLLCFSMQPLAGALTRTVGEDENKSKIAIEISRKILLWMEKEDHAAARYVLLKGLVTREMREEIFCQLLRMLYRNGGTHFALNIWKLILFCCSTFRPPTSFTKYLLSFLYMHCSAEVREEENRLIASANKSRKKEKERRLDLATEPKKFDDRTIMFPLYGNRDVSILAAFTLKALRRTFQKGDRRMVPSVTELEALGQMEKIVCRFCMMDGRTSAFYVDAATTVSDVLASMCERIRITNSHGWSLLVTYNDHTYKLLRPNDRLVDILATYEELKKSMKLSKNIHIIDVDVQFVLKKLFFFEGPPERRDDIEINLLCWQAQNDLRCGRLWCSLAQTSKFAAIQLQYQVGDHDPKLNITEMLPQLLSKEMLNARDASYWPRAIAAEHEKLVGVDPASAKKAYLQMASELPFYGHLPFIISTPPPREGEAPRVQPLGLPDKFALLIGATAVVFYNLETKEQILKFDYSKVYEWSYSSTELYMTVFHSNNTAMDLVFPTTLGDDVSYMLTSYVDKLKEKAKYARALLDYKVDDESLLSFEKGAIINIIERSIDGWCLGEVQGKQGMFPVAMTEFILTDSADLSLIPMQPHSERRKKASGSTMRAGPIPLPEETKTSSKKKKETSSRKRTPTLRALGTLLLGDTKASTKSSNNNKEEPLPSGSFYSPARGKRVEVVVGKAGGAHTMVAWAEYNFNKASTSKSGTLMKWKVSSNASPNEMLSFSMSPIKVPLLVFNEVSSKEKKEKLGKQAVKIFTSIMKFMGDFPLGKSDRTKLAQEIVQEGLDEVLLRDEIYCQLIKQTNNNPKSGSMLKGFELMGLCVACFTGSPSFSPYLTQFLAEASDLSSDRDAVSADHARRVLRRLLKTMQVAHEREQAPSIFEIKALADSTPIMCMVELPDGDVKAFAVESHTTLQEASKDFATKLGLPAKFTEGWGLWQSGLDGCYPLKQTLLVCDALALWEKGISASTAASSDAAARPSHSSAELVSSSAQTRQDRRRSTHYDTKRRVRPLSGRLTLASDMLAAGDDSGGAAGGSKRFRRSVTAALLPEVDRMFGFIFKKLTWMHNEFTADELIADSEALNYLCEQVVEDILGVLPLGEADAVEYSSLLATARKPGAWRSLTAEQIMDFIPASVMNKRTGDQWLALMNGSLYAHQEKSTLQALGAVMERYFKSEFYGATVFPIVTKDSKLPEKALLAINVDRVAIYHPQTLELCQAWSYGDISQWTMSSKDTWAIFVGDLFKPQCFTCHSPWANEIKMLYRTYAELVAASSEGSTDS